MRYRELGKTGLRVSEIGLGAEWLERHSAEEVKAVIDRCEEHGINILDCWMPEPNVRTNIGAAIASGTFETEGMAVVPCSMKTLAGICHGYAENLLLRAADVTLKERRKLVLVARETPLGLVHLRNMTALAEMGVTILPPMLTYYQHPQSIEDMTTHIVGKIMREFRLEAPGFRRWEGS